jgi:hypothetical protein
MRLTEAPYLFVSHATADNPRLRPVVLALLDAGIGLWFDKPQEINIPHDRFVGYIGNAEDYRVAIEQALAASWGVLVFPTAAWQASKECFSEGRRAFEREQDLQRQGYEYRISPALLEAGDYKFLSDDLDSKQGYRTLTIAGPDGDYVLHADTDPDTADGARNVELLIAETRAYFQRTALNPPPGARRQRGVRSGANPYLVDRREQRDEARDHLAPLLAPAPGGERIPLLITFGAAADEPDKFGCATLPRRVLHSLTDTPTAAALNPRTIPWPSAKPSDAKRFAAQLDANLGEFLFLADRSGGPQGRAAIAARVRKENIRRVACFQLASAHPAQPIRAPSALRAHLRAWITYWAGFPLADATDAEGRPLLFPVLALDLAAPGGHREKAGAARAQAKRRENNDARLRKWLTGRNRARDLSAGARSVAAVILPPLQAVTPDCVREWVETDQISFPGLLAQSAQAAEILKHLREAVFKGGDALPMRAWADGALVALKDMDV